MQVKKFEAPTMQEAIDVVKKEMGYDAIVLSTKQKKNKLGLTKGSFIEITAAFSEGELNKKLMHEKYINKEYKENDFLKGRDLNKNKYHLNKSIENIDEDKINLSDAAKRKFEGEVTFDKTEFLLEEVKDLKQVVFGLEDEFRKKENQAFINDLELNRVFANFYYFLINSGMEKKDANELITNIVPEVKKENKTDQDFIQEKLALSLLNGIRTTNFTENIDFDLRASYPKYIALMGPTGVGKTTMAAKVASHLIVNKNLKVGLVNLDLDGTGLLDQLSVYATLTKVPFRQVKMKEEIDRMLYDFEALDLVILDTAGFGKNDKEQLKKNLDALSLVPNLQSSLVISAAASYLDMMDTINKYKSFKANSLIFSKLDESSTFGSIYSIQLRAGLPLSYFSIGQKIPEDFEEASRERVVDLILDL